MMWSIENAVYIIFKSSRNTHGTAFTADKIRLDYDIEVFIKYSASPTLSDPNYQYFRLTTHHVHNIDEQKKRNRVEFWCLGI